MRRITLPLILGLALTPRLAGQALKLMTRDFAKVQALARADSNDAEIQYYLALAHWQKHHWKQADSLLRLVIRLDPRFAEAYLALAHLPYARRPVLADEEYRGVVSEELRPALEEARRFYQRAFRTDPLVDLRSYSVIYEIEDLQTTDLTALQHLRYLRYYAWRDDLGMGRYQSAYDRLRTLGQTTFDESKHPDRVPDYILWYRGLAAAHSRQYAPAIADFQALLDRTLKQQQRDEIVHVPLKDNEYRFMLAALNDVTGHADRAAALYREALENDLGLVMAHTYLAVLHENAGHADSALVERQRAAEVSEDDPVALFDYAASLFNVQRTIDAEEPLLRAVALNPRYAPAHYLLGRVYEELGLGAEARDAYTTFLVVAPQRLRDLIEDANRRLAKLPPAEAHR
jgi:tetratricopeptide (TPR) repeat protein